MATNWIKMRVDLQTHPKVVRLSTILRADRLRITGALFAVWSLFDTHSVDGLLEGYTIDALNKLLSFPGFVEAMSSVEWLEIGPDWLRVPRFDEHNGQSAKRRAQESERKRNARKKSDEDTDKVRTRVEKDEIPEASASGSRATKKCPEAFEVTEDLARWAAVEAPGVNLKLETAKFRDYTFASARRDWAGTWRNWIRKAALDLPRIRHAATGETAHQKHVRERIASLAPNIASRLPSAQIFPVIEDVSNVVSLPSH